MAEPRTNRRLAAILAADVVGYSRMMASDEAGTLAALKHHREVVFDPSVAEHGGRIVKLMGDGTLVEFGSVVDAVKCALMVQRFPLEPDAGQPIVLRIGINLGDIIIDGDDIYGDGVNIAARLEPLAEPGGICVAAVVNDNMGSRIDARFVDAGEVQVKNIERSIRIWKWHPTDQVDPMPWPPSSPSANIRPSLAVLPFQNMSGDAEQEYFSDGVVEDIITGLSRFRSFAVIARNSSFVYKGRAVDVRQIAKELDVRYVLEGSVRKAGNRVRIAGQLIEASTGAHLWAERFDGGLEDIFSLQDQVTAKVVGAIAPTLEQAEIQRAKRKPTESLDAYDYFLRGMAALHSGTREANTEARRLFLKAIDFDSDFASAYGMAAFCSVWNKTNGWMTDPVAEGIEAERLCRRAIELGKDNAVALARAGHALGFVVGDLDAGAGLIDLALALNPNLASAWYSSGWIRVYLGESDTAIAHLARAMELSPLDPEINQMQTGTAFGYFLSGRYEEAIPWAQKALQERPNYQSAVRVAAASLALSGRLHEAQNAMVHLRELDPVLRISNLKDRVPLRRAEDFARYADGLRKAGLPE